MPSPNSTPFSFKDVIECGGCSAKSLSETYNFGDVPLAGYFPIPSEIPLPLLPMKLMYCNNCTLLQISPDLDDRFLFSEYRYLSSIGMSGHFRELSDWFCSSENPDKDSRILEIGCNDGPLLTWLTKKGFSPIGIDPATNIVQRARESGLTVINDFFGLEAVSCYEELRNLDYIFSANSFAHISDIKSIAAAISSALSATGKFIVEVQSLTELVKRNAFDFVYHEHKYYYTIKSISNLMSQYSMYLESCQIVEIHGGSYRFVFTKQPAEFSESLQEMLREEIDLHLDSAGINLAVNRYLLALKDFDLYVQAASSEHKKIVAFGASGRANMLLGHLPRTKKVIPYVIDESPERIGRNMGQNLVPIKALSEVNCDDFDIVLILAWNFAESIIDKWPNKEATFAIPLPSIEVTTRSSHNL